MYAVIKTGGKQYRVEKGREYKLEKIGGKVGDLITFDQVLLASDGEDIKTGSPFLNDVKVNGKITRQGRGRKVVVFKYRRRKGFKKKRGHRQHFTLIRIEDIKI